MGFVRMLDLCYCAIWCPYIYSDALNWFVIFWNLTGNMRATTGLQITNHIYEGWNFNSEKYLFTTDTK